MTNRRRHMPNHRRLSLPKYRQHSKWQVSNRRQVAYPTSPGVAYRCVSPKGREMGEAALPL